MKPKEIQDKKVRELTAAEKVRELTPAELAKQLGDSRRELLNLRIQASNGQLENTARLSQVRRDIARMITECRQRQLKEVQAP